MVVHVGSPGRDVHCCYGGDCLKILMPLAFSLTSICLLISSTSAPRHDSHPRTSGSDTASACSTDRSVLGQWHEPAQTVVLHVESSPDEDAEIHAEQH
jgi:hypothetical protein